MSWSGLAKFVLGFMLAIALLFFAGASITRYLITKLTTPPPRPEFPNDSPTPASATPQPSQAPVASRSPSPSPSPANPPGSYNARVTQPIGLILREEPNRDSAQVGGIEYQQAITVLEESPNGEWLRVRLPGSDVEGWIKAGNTEKVE